MFPSFLPPITLALLSLPLMMLLTLDDLDVHFSRSMMDYIAVYLTKESWSTYFTHRCASFTTVGMSVWEGGKAGGCRKRKGDGPIIDFFTLPMLFISSLSSDCVYIQSIARYLPW